jgi:hypothetical protein
MSVIIQLYIPFLAAYCSKAWIMEPKERVPPPLPNLNLVPDNDYRSGNGAQEQPGTLRTRNLCTVKKNQRQFGTESFL